MNSVNKYNVKLNNEFFKITVYSLLSFFISFTFSSPQLLIGSIINSILIFSVFNIKKDVTFLLIAPSLGALVRGALFGPFSIFLVFLMPFIWVSNFLLIKSMKFFVIEKKFNYFFSLMFSGGIKSIFLFSFTSILVWLNIIPNIFLVSMGLIQFFTCFLGGLISFGLKQVRY